MEWLKGSPMATAEIAKRLTRLLGGMTRPAAIATVSAHGRVAGCVVGLHTQCSIAPMRMLVCISKSNFTHTVAATAKGLALHYPSANDHELARCFGEETGFDHDKFEGRRTTTLTAPEAVILDEIPNAWAGVIHARYDFGDHTGLVVEPQWIRTSSCFEQLDVDDLDDVEPGHPRAPRAASQTTLVT